MGTCPSATAAAEPDEEPPGVRLRSLGFRHDPPREVAANSVVAVLPRMMAPADRRIETMAASAGAGSS